MNQTYTKIEVESNKEQVNYREYVNTEALKVLIRWKVKSGELKFS
jgi:hypothetical protein